MHVPIVIECLEENLKYQQEKLETSNWELQRAIINKEDIEKRIVYLIKYIEEIKHSITQLKPQ